MVIDKQKPNSKNQRQQNTRSSSALSDQLTLEQQKKRKFYIKETIYLLYYIGRIALTVAILVILHENFIYRITLTDEYARMQENIELWKKDVIINITTINSYNCPEGYQTYTSYEWPGTKQGCYCYTQLGEWDYIKILQGACNDMAMSAGCRTVKKVEPIPFLFWKKDQLLCIKRIKNLDFFTALQPQNIPAIQCAKNTDYQIGIPFQLNLTLCPITDIDNDKNTLKEQLPEIQFSYARQSQYPIVAIKMTEYEFCPDFQRQNISPFKQRANNYNLENKFRSYCQGVDTRVVEIDEIGEDQLFKSNPRILDVVKQLPAYPEPMSDYRYKLGFIRYPEWKYICRKSEQFALQIAEKQLNLEDVLIYSNLCISLGTIFVVVIGALFTIFYIYRKIYEFYYRVNSCVLYDTLPELEKKRPNLYEKLHKKFATQLIIFLASLLLALGMIIIMAVLYQELQDNFEWYKKSKSCTSQTMKQWIDLGYVKYFDLQQRNSLLCIILVLVLIILDTIMFLWRNFKGDMKKEELDEEVTNIFDDQFAKNNDQKVDIFNLDINEKEIQMDKISKQSFSNLSNNYNFMLRNSQHNEQVNITEESLVSKEERQSRIMVRPKRPKRAKALESSQMSDATQQWDV